MGELKRIEDGDDEAAKCQAAGDLAEQSAGILEVVEHRRENNQVPASLIPGKERLQLRHLRLWLVAER